MKIVEELHQSLCQLARDVEDLPGVSQALRRFAGELPGQNELAHEPAPRRGSAPIRSLLYGALDEGWIDGRAFDRLMIASCRAERGMSRQATI